MSQFTGLNRIGQLQRWISLSCRRAKIRAEYRDGIPTAYATKDSVVIPRINSAMTEDDEALLRFQVCHETDGHHNNGPEVFDIIEEYNVDMRKPLGAILNIIEDQRIERAASAEYDGNAHVISNGREVTGRRSLVHIEGLTAKLKPDQLSDDTMKMQAVYLTALVSQSEWCVGASLHLRDEIALATGHFTGVAGYMRKLVDFGLVTSIRTLEDGYASWDLAKRVYGLLWDKTEEQVEQEVKEQQAKAKEKGKEKSSGAEEGDPTGSDPAHDGEAVEGIDPRTGKYTIPVEYFVKSNHTGDDTGGHGLGLDFTNHTEIDKFTPCPFDEFKVRDYRTDPPVCTGRLSAYGSTDMLTATSSFANKMRRYLQVKTAAYYEGGKRKGTINSRALYRAGVPMVGDGQWNQTVFRQKHTSDMLDTAVTLLCDVSGSMSGPKVAHATRSCVLLNHVISNTLRVNTEILTFTHMHSPEMGIIKAFGDRASDDRIIERFDDQCYRMWGNDDADAILWAYDRLLRQKNKRKVLIVLSDGSPADGYMDTDPYHALKVTVKEIHEGKLASIIGIGIMDRSVERFYPKHTIIQKAEELEDCLLTVINKQILNVA